MEKPLLLLFDRLGPYHVARIAALNRLAPTVAVETFKFTSEYAWDVVTGDLGFERQTLFELSGSRNKMPSPQAIASRIKAVLRRVNPAAVLVPGWATSAALAALHWCLENNVPAVVMSESNAFDERRRWFTEYLKRQIVSLYRAGLAGGHLQLAYLVALGIPRERVFTGYDVVDNGYFSEATARLRSAGDAVRKATGLPQHYFLASGRFIGKKNHLRLLHAYARYREEAGQHAWSLVLLGDGPLKAEVCDLIYNLGIESDVLLPGFIQYPQLPTYYAFAGAFVHPSSSEQWGLVVNEAMASRLPVLVSNRCGCATDLVIEGENGWTFNPNDVQAVAAALQRMASTPQSQRRLMGDRSVERIDHYSPEVFATGAYSAARSALSTECADPNWLQRAILCSLIRRVR